MPIGPGQPKVETPLVKSSSDCRSAGLDNAYQCGRRERYSHLATESWSPHVKSAATSVARDDDVGVQPGGREQAVAGDC